jgi:hypothetical protein
MIGTQEQRDIKTELCSWKLGVVFLLACAVIISRRLDAICHPQFWAEDGHVWIADAVNRGWWPALFRAQDGYFQTLPRLTASVALLVPLSLAPLVLNIVAIVVQALPVSLLLSFRSTGWGNLRFRALMAGIYLALPNCKEMSFGITESQWLLALSAFLLLVAASPQNAFNRIFDLIVFLLCGLTGPFCIFLLPLALYLALTRHDSWRWVLLGVLSALALVQAWALLILNSSGRPHYPLGASPAMFTRILAGQVYLGVLLGHNSLAGVPGSGVFIFLVCISIIGTMIVAFCFFKAAVEMRLFITLSAMLLAGSLITSSTYPPRGVSVWQLLAAISGIRYWFFPCLAFAWSILWCVHSKVTVLKAGSAYLLVFMCIGIVRDWRHPLFQDLHFAESASRFESAPAGTALTIPLNPAGWNMQLIKRKRLQGP